MRLGQYLGVRLAGHVVGRGRRGLFLGADAFHLLIPTDVDRVETPAVTALDEAKWTRGTLLRTFQSWGRGRIASGVGGLILQHPLKTQQVIGLTGMKLEVILVMDLTTNLLNSNPKF